MNKLILAIAVALSFVLPVFTGNIFAADAEAVSEKELTDATQYWSENFSAGVRKGFEMASGKEVPADKQKLIGKHVADFGAKTLLPFLKRNNLTAEWIKCQNDPEIRAINTKALQAKTMQEMQTLMVSSIQLLQKKYPGLLTRDSVYDTAFTHLVGRLAEVLLEE